MNPVLDKMKRPMRDLRISVTDRCNFRCGYCMPADRTYRFLPKPELLSFEEILRLVRIFVEGGVKKIRLTGGEPLLRRDLHLLVAGLKQIAGIEDIALTTNGWLLADAAAALKDAGLDRLTISLDSLDPQSFARLSGRNMDLNRVLHGVDTAAQAGFPIKLNMVVQKGINDHEIVPMAQYARSKGFTPRFIEFMDVGNLNGWNMERVVSGAEMRAAIHQVWPVEPLDPDYSGEVAKRYRFIDGMGEFGLITSVTQPFCGACSRMRLSADGQLYTCLFSGKGTDLKGPLRAGEDPGTVIGNLWSARTDRYSELRGLGELPAADKVEMYHIGG